MSSFTRLSRISKPTPATAADAAPCNLSAGQQVLHQRFGRGIVERIEGTGDNLKATVRFDNAGTKQLLLKFAKLQVL